MRTKHRLWEPINEPEVRNRILLALLPELREHLLGECEYVEFLHRHVIYPVGTPVDHVYFINSGLVSLIKTMGNGQSVEIGAVGIEGLVGLFAVFGFHQAIADFMVQIPTAAFRISRSTLRNEMSKHEELRQLIEKYMFLLVQQLAQSAACNRLHSLEQRCCQWLLRAHDNAFSNTFVLIHEFLALLLGAQRPSISVVAHQLQQRGLISYVHGRVTVLDRAAIEQSACECYVSSRKLTDMLFDSRSPVSVD
jgi:CRP-like cAMP-binding protein